VHASRKAISARCPNCTGPLQFQDYTLTTPHHGELATLGEIHITAACSLQGRLVCGRLINAGRLEGNVVVHGQVELQPQSQTTGHLNARSLTVQRGAVLLARTAIGPTAQPDPSHRPTAANRLVPDT
jgi:cytoskeletal protein CcmA (bactofilin family)